ncbi:MAG: hypothetical protein RL015_2607 [Verrucomicrobiota bacterium]
MFHFWADLLRIQSRANGGQVEMTSMPYLEHVKRRIRENMPYDAFIRELLTPQGQGVGQSRHRRQTGPPRLACRR